MENRIVLELDPSSDNPRNSEGAFVTLADGTVLFAYTHFYGGRDDASPARLVLRRSQDGGRSWTEADELLLDNEAGENVMSVSLCRLCDGRIALFYVRKNSIRDCRARMRISADEARTWSDPVLVVEAPGYFVLNNDRVVQLRSGRIIVPLAFHRNRSETTGQGWSRAADGRGILFWVLSDDLGATWREARTWWACPQQNDAGLQEPGVVELRNGRLFCWARTRLGCQYACYSDDAGETWTSPEPTRFLSPCSPLSLKRMPGDGRLLAIWNDHSGRLIACPSGAAKQARTPLVAAVSADEGATWSLGRLLEDSPAHGFCYTAIHFVEDAVLLAYCAGGSETAGILNRLRLRRVSCDWFTAPPGGSTR